MWTVQLGWPAFLGASLMVGMWVSLLIYFALPTWKVRHIPVPPYTWGVGHLKLLESETHQAFIFTKLAREYGPMYRFHLGRQPVVMVADAELWRQVALSKFMRNRSNPPSSGASLLQSAIFFSRDEQWVGMKNTILPMFHTEQLHVYGPLMTRILGLLVDRLSALKETEDVNLMDFLQRMAMDMIGEVAFGTQFGLLEGKPGPDDHMVKTAIASMAALRMGMEAGVPISTIAGTFLPFLEGPLRAVLRRFSGSPEWRATKSDESLTRRLNEITERRALQTAEGLSSRIDALSLLLNSSRMSKENKKLLTKRHIRALTYEMLLVGTETTSTTMAFTTYLLATNPRVEKKMLEEIDAFGPLKSVMTEEDLAKFPYVGMVYKESMRVMNATPVIAREVGEDMQLGGYHLPKGTWVWLALEAMLMDPKYFADPEEFRPERFDENCEEQKKRHPYAYSPFGMGPRSCPGKRLAVKEAMLLLIILYKNFTISLSPLTKVPLQTQFGLVVRPKYEYFVRIHKRHT